MASPKKLQLNRYKTLRKIGIYYSFQEEAALFEQNDNFLQNKRLFFKYLSKLSGRELSNAGPIFKTNSGVSTKNA